MIHPSDRYRKNQISTIVTWVIIIASGGLLRLFFHWVPRLMLQATHSKCSLDEADTVLLVEKFQGKHAIHHVKPLTTLIARDVMLVLYI